MKIDFQVNYSRLSAFYKTITFTKVPLSWGRWVHLFISLRIFFLSSFLPLVFHSLTESLKRPCNYRQTVLIDRSGNDTGVMGKLRNMKSEKSIWLWDGGKGGRLFSQRMSCCGQVVDRASGQLIDPRMWPTDGSETRHGGLPVVRPLAGMLVLHHCQTQPGILTWQWLTAPPKCAGDVCVLCLFFMWACLWGFWLRPLVLPHFL